MRIAVATDQNQIAGHFSKCEGFRVYEFEGDLIHVHDYFENDESLKGRLPEVFESMGISTVIAGGIGQGQLQKLEDKGLWVFHGIKGEISEAILKLKQGMLLPEEEGSESTEAHVCCGKHGEGSSGCGSHGKGSAGGCGCK